MNNKYNKYNGILFLIIFVYLILGNFYSFSSKLNSDPYNYVIEKWQVVSNNYNGFEIKYSNPGHNGGISFINFANFIKRTGYGSTSPAPYNKEYYSVAEMLFYPETFIKLPVVLGTKWNEEYIWHRGKGWVVEVEISSISDVVTIDNKNYNDCIKIIMKISGEGQLDPKYYDESWQEVIRGTKTIWLKKGIGIIKIEYSHENNTKSIIELIKSKVKRKDGNQYIPYSIGNQWEYKWAFYY